MRCRAKVGVVFLFAISGWLSTACGDFMGPEYSEVAWLGGIELRAVLERTSGKPDHKGAADRHRREPNGSPDHVPLLALVPNVRPRIWRGCGRLEGAPERLRSVARLK